MNLPNSKRPAASEGYTVYRRRRTLQYLIADKLYDYLNVIKTDIICNKNF